MMATTTRGAKLTAPRASSSNAATAAAALSLLESPCLTDLKLNLRAASVQTLVEQAVLAFRGCQFCCLLGVSPAYTSADDNEEVEPLTALPSALFLVHKWYISSPNLAKLFLDLVCLRLQLIPSVCRTIRFVALVLPFTMETNFHSPSIRYWIGLFPEHFDSESDPELCDTIEGIKREAFSAGFAKAANLISTHDM